MPGRYSMKQAATQIGVHKLTLYRWERGGKIPSAKRFAHKNERVYTDEDIQAIREWKDKIADVYSPSHDSVEAGVPANEIEITPEMIEAGVLAMLPFEDAIDEPREAVERIFRAMVMVSRRG